MLKVGQSYRSAIDYTFYTDSTFRFPVNNQPSLSKLSSFLVVEIDHSQDGYKIAYKILAPGCIGWIKNFSGHGYIVDILEEEEDQEETSS